MKARAFEDGEPFIRDPANMADGGHAVQQAQEHVGHTVERETGEPDHARLAQVRAGRKGDAGLEQPHERDEGF